MKSGFLYLPVFVFSTACSTAKKAALPVLPDQGIEGYVQKISGNQMPSPDVKRPGPKNISTTVYIYEITNMSQAERVNTSAFYTAIHTKLVQTVNSDSTGHFVAALPIGAYSLFTKTDERFYANSFDINNNIAPVTVQKNKRTQVKILISSDAVY